MDRDAERADRQDEAPQGDHGLAAEPVVDQGDLEGEHDPGLAAEPAVDQGSYGQDPGAAGPRVVPAGERVEDAGPSDRSVFADEPPGPERSAFATEDAGSADRATVAEDPARAAGYQAEPGGQDGVYDQEADQARQRPSDS
jgi:hypothetical protein